MKVESIVDYTKTNIVGEYASLDQFIKTWNSKDKKDEIIQLFHDKGIDFEALKKEENMIDVDDFDYICHIAYDQKPLTRKERSMKLKQQKY